MVDATLAAKKSSSFDLVEREINNTIEQAELSLERFQENRESGEDLQNCIDYLNQLRGIFVLIELQGGTVLCQESVAIANEVPVGAAEDKNGLLSSLSQALFVLRRYTEYYQRRREDHPELLLEIINLLRLSRRAKPLPDSYFFDVEFQRSPPKPVRDASVTTDVFEHRSRRLRHMYQVGLLNLLRSKETDIGYRLMSRAADGMSKICAGSSISELWSLTAYTVELMHTQSMELTPTRQRLLMKIEKYAREIVKLGKVATAKAISETVAKDLLYLIAISGDKGEKTRELLAGYSLAPADFDQAKIIAHRSLLMGPGSDVLASLSKALHEEISQIKDKLDIIERGIDGQEDGLSQIAEGLGKLADTLTMLDLINLSAVARGVHQTISSWAMDKKHPSNTDLMQVADSVLSIEQAILQLEEDGLTIETDKVVGADAEEMISPYLMEAHIVVIGESQAGLSLAKRAITAYLESGGDKLHLANVLPTLEGVLGALVMIEQSRAAKALHATARCIEEKLIKNENKPGDHVLETLADALTSLEYYVDSVGRSGAGNPELLKLAEESVHSLGY
ncbi:MULTISPECIES: chemotaxis protein [unclassified Hahella]|uniref:chemotaxis protein n=1 Tax=unclassified Hahella TaxID=2624107 RepID=UPI001C1EEDF5|nr:MULTISPECIES: chemotaxis protein [unclassified Hahella]MBU6950893.1 chemotaxis protein [Hahella sp. HN01]MDG9667213.1 chemotaxis protein [Hahella sp. CR1]